MNIEKNVEKIRNEAVGARVALLWVCPYCDHARVSEHPETVVARNVALGSKAQRLTATCENDDCPGSNVQTYRRPLSKSRGGRRTVNLNSQQNCWVEAMVNSRNRGQVQRLKDIAEGHNIAIAMGDVSTILQRMNEWSMQVSREPFTGGARPMPWRRWDDLRGGL